MREPPVARGAGDALERRRLDLESRARLEGDGARTHTLSRLAHRANEKVLTAYTKEGASITRTLWPKADAWKADTAS